MYASFLSIDDVHKAFFLIKKITQSSPKVAEQSLAELLAYQNDPTYRKAERDHLYQLFLSHINDFMDDGGFAVDLYGKESDYLNSLKQRTEALLTAGKASIKDGAVLMRPSPTLTQPPLMIRHQDGRYLYAGIDLEAIYYRVNFLNAKNRYLYTFFKAFFFST